jgi:cupin fold WbuC family metalloprotein
MDDIQGFRQDDSSMSPTFYSETPTNSISREQIAALKVVAVNGGGVARLCLHSSPDAAMHIMVIAQTSGRYWRPKKHVTKVKSFNVLEGKMAVVEFTDMGDPANVTLLQHDARPLMLMAPSTFHTNIAITQMCVHVEAIQGPYLHGEPDRVVASFAPDEEQVDAGRSFISGVIERLLREGP